MKKLLITAVLAASTSVAFAQNADQTGESGEAQYEGKAVPGDSGRASGPGTEQHAGDTPDPTRHFNWASHWLDYKKYDEYGGPLGDGKMIDPVTHQVVMQTEEKVVTDPDGKQHVVEERVPAEEEPMSPPFVLMLLNFGILLLILGKYGGPFARKTAEDRHDQIKQALDEAAKLREQAAKKLAEYETRIKDVDSEVAKLVEGIRADAEADKKRILEAASAQAAQMKRDAEQRIAAEIELARAQLTKEVTAAAAGATEKLLREKVTQDDQNKLVSTFLTNMASTATTKEHR